MMQPVKHAGAPGRSIARRGLSLVEMMIALAISALLLTATMAALDASFKAYASATEQATTQITTRMVVDRLLTLMRTSTAHGPLQESATAPVVTRNGDFLTSSYIELVDPRNRILRIEYRPDAQQLWMVLNPGMTGETAEPLIDGVTAASFTLLRRQDRSGVWVLARGSADITISPAPDAALPIEAGDRTPFRVIASTAPRKLN